MEVDTKEQRKLVGRLVRLRSEKGKTVTGIVRPRQGFPSKWKILLTTQNGVDLALRLEKFDVLEVVS